MNNDLMTLDKLLNSKAFVKGASTFDSPAKLLEEPLNIMSKTATEFKVRVSNKVVNAEEDKTLNEAYSRVLIEPVYPTILEGMVGKIGLLYALDTQIPTLKVFTGTEVTACTNLTIFRAEDIFSGHLDNMKSAIKFLEQYATEIEETMSEYVQFKKDLTEMEYDSKQLNEVVGNLLKHSIRNSHLGVTPIVSAAKELHNPASVYYVNSEDNTNAWNVYNAVTHHLKKADIKDQASKTLLLSKFWFN